MLRCYSVDRSEGWAVTFFRDTRRVYQAESLPNERLVAVVCDQETSELSLEKNSLFEIRFNGENLIVTI